MTTWDDDSWKDFGAALWAWCQDNKGFSEGLSDEVLRRKLYRRTTKRFDMALYSEASNVLVELKRPATIKRNSQLIEQGWLAFASQSLPEPSDADAQAMIRLIFMAGAHLMWSLVNERPGDPQRLDELADELRRIRDEKTD